MDTGMVFPDARSTENKEFSLHEEIFNKLYSPFLEKFLSKKSPVVMAISNLQTVLSTQLLKMISIVRDIYNKKIEEDEKENKKQKEDDKLKDTPEEKTKKKETDKRWYKIVKAKWFDKVGGWLRTMASTSFLASLLAFIVALRFGLIQLILPWLVDVVGGAIKEIIKAIPGLLEFFFDLLWVTIPNILKEIFREIFKALGIENKALLKFGDMIAKVLPMLIAVSLIIDKLFPVVKAVFHFLGFIGKAVFKVFGLFGKIFGFLKTIWTWAVLLGKLIAAIGASTIGIVVLIIAAIAAIGYAIYKNWDVIKKYLIETFTKIKETIVPVFNWFKDTIYKFIIDLWSKLSPIFNDIKIGLSRMYNEMLKPVLTWLSDKLSKLYEIIKPVLIWLSDKLSKLYEIIKPVFKIVFTIIKIVFTTILDVISTIIVSIFKVIKFIILLPLYIYDGIKFLIEEIPKKFTEIKEAILNIFNDIGSWFSDKWNNIKNSAISTSEDVNNWFGGIFDSIKTNSSSMIDKFKNQVNNIEVSGIKSKFDNMLSSFDFSGIKNKFSEIFNPKRISTYIKFISLYSQKMFLNLIKNFKNLPKVISDIFVKIKNNIKDKFKSFTSPFTDIFSGLKDISIKPEIMNKIGPLLSDIGKFVSSMGHKLENVFDTVTSAFYGILDFLGNIITYGASDWMSMKKTGEAAKIEKAQQFARTKQGEVIEKMAKAEAGNKIAEAEAKQVLGSKFETGLEMANLYRQYKKNKGKLDFGTWMGERSYHQGNVEGSGERVYKGLNELIDLLKQDQAKGAQQVKPMSNIVTSKTAADLAQ